MDRKINRLIDLTQKEMKGDTVKQKLEKKTGTVLFTVIHIMRKTTRNRTINCQLTLQYVPFQVDGRCRWLSQLM